MAFSRLRFEPSAARSLVCPDCGRPLIYDRTCLRVMLSCQACGKDFDPSRFVDQLDDDFEEAYANIPLNRL